MLAGLALGCALSAQAAPFAVQIGQARVALDSPPGFSDTLFTGSPRLQELAETLTSASNRILLFALTDADLRRFTLGDPIEAKRYMVAVTPRGMERDFIAGPAFSAFVSESLRELGTPPAAGTDPRAYLDEREGAQRLLAELRRDPDVVSVLQGARIPGQSRLDAPQYMLATTTLLRLRGKALNLTVHSVYETREDLDWIRDVTARWVEELQRLNTR